MGRLSIATLPIVCLLVSSMFIGCGQPEPDTTQAPKANSSPERTAASPLKSARMAGPSMEPAIRDGDRVDLLPVDRELMRGDVVMFSSPTDPPITMAKRIVGLPTETIEIKNGQVLINGTALDEPYIMEPPSYSFDTTVILDGSYIILGDNRNHSKDSHDFGAVPIGNIQYIVETR